MNTEQLCRRQRDLRLGVIKINPLKEETKNPKPECVFVVSASCLLMGVSKITCATIAGPRLCQTNFNVPSARKQ